MIFVVTYHSPDIDGIACLIAYSELLKKKGIITSPTFFGDLSKEVEFVKKYTNFFPLEKHEGYYPEDSEFVLVDTADPDALEPGIPLEKVKEIFDHRELVFTEKFVNARLNIDKVGSCATLITEKFRKEDFKPSQNVAIYLYAAIISNTINFKNSVTTQKDVDAADWLRPIAKVEDDYIKKMFEYKSKINNKDDLLFLIEQDFAIKEMHNKNIGIAQVEIANLEKVINFYKKDIEEDLRKLKKEEKIDYVLFTGIDIIKGFNVFITTDNESEKFFSSVLGVPKIGNKYKKDGIIMRKEIWPRVEDILKQSIAG